MNAHRDPLSEPDPLESRIGIYEEFGAAGIVAIGDAAGDALHMSAQCSAAVEQIDFGLFSETYSGDLRFLEIPRNPVGVAVDQRHDLGADGGVLTDFEGEVGDKPVDWELATGRARSLQDLAKRDGITRCYIRRLVGLAFLSLQLVEAILQVGNPSSSPRRG